MTKKKPFKRWKKEYQQHLINNTPITIEGVEQIEDLSLFDAWADGLSPKEAIDNGV